MRSFTLLSVATLLFVFPSLGNATLAGTSVNGSLTFGGDSSNYFDPGYGFVPATGYLNTFGTTVTISDTAVEFGFNDGASLISADFSANRLTVKDLIETAGPSNSFQMVFTDSAFAGQYLIPVIDSFPLDLHAVVGDAVTLDYAGGSSTPGQTLSANFIVAPIPEPSTFCLLSIAALAVSFSARNLRCRGN